MSVITGIVPTTRQPGRFDLVVDGEPFATLSLDALDRLQLAVGRSIEGLEERIATEAAELRVYDRAVAMLAFRARASKELARTLIRKGEDKALVDRAVQRLQDQGFLDDASFARSFTRARVVGAQHARRRVQQELSRKGVARDVADEAIRTVFDEEGFDQRQVVEEAARKKMRTLAKLDPVVQRRRLYAFLARRGFDADDIRSVMSMKFGSADISE
jgi:regulatory protein